MTWRDRAKQAVEKNSGGKAPTKPTKPLFVSSVSSPTPPVSKKERDYTQAEWEELGSLLNELAELEGWSAEELAEAMDERGRMASVNVRKALAALRIATREALAPWPQPPTKRARITLCELTSRRQEFAVLDGGKTAEPEDLAPEAA